MKASRGCRYDDHAVIQNSDKTGGHSYIFSESPQVWMEQSSASLKEYTS